MASGNSIAQRHTHKNAQRYETLCSVAEKVSSAQETEQIRWKSSAQIQMGALIKVDISQAISFRSEELLPLLPETGGGNNELQKLLSMQKLFALAVFCAEEGKE